MSEPLLKYRQPTAPQDILTEAMPARLYTEGSGLNLARAALFGVSLDKVKAIVELLRTYRGGRPNSLIMGGPMGWSWYATIDTAHHGALAGPANAHRHSDLADIGIDDHHARDHATRHHSGGGDALALGSIAGNLTDAQHGVRTLANAHAHSHLSGIGANDHHAQAHTLASHSTKAHAELTGVGANDHHARDHALGGATHTADTLANLNLKISDANLDDQGAARPPQSHALGGAAHSADTFANLTGKVSDATLQKRGDVITDAEHGSRTQANAHAHSHLSGVGINDHHNRDHAATHLIGGADALSVGTPVAIGASNADGSATNLARRDHIHAHGATVRCNGNFSSIDMRIRCRTSDPASPADGETWLRTDL